MGQAALVDRLKTNDRETAIGVALECLSGHVFDGAGSRNMAQAGMLIILLIAPMIFLSGAWTPPEAMPDVIRWMMMFSPLHYFIDAGYGVLLKGATVTSLVPQILGICILGGINFALSLWRFRRQFA